MTIRVIRNFTSLSGNYYPEGEVICLGEYEEMTIDEREFCLVEDGEGADPEWYED